MGAGTKSNCHHKLCVNCKYATNLFSVLGIIHFHQRKCVWKGIQLGEAFKENIWTLSSQEHRDLPLHLHHNIRPHPWRDLWGQFWQAVLHHFQAEGLWRISEDMQQTGHQGLQWPGQGGQDPLTKKQMAKQKSTYPSFLPSLGVPDSLLFIVHHQVCGGQGRPATGGHLFCHRNSVGRAAALWTVSRV